MKSIYAHKWFCLSKGLTGPRGEPGPVGPPGQKVSFNLIHFIHYFTFQLKISESAHRYLNFKVLGLSCEWLYYY